MLTLKEPTVVRLNQWLKEFCAKVQDNCDTYAFYRAELYSNSNGNLCVDFLASDYEGRFKKPSFEYDPEDNTLFYERGSKFNFKNEGVTKKAVRTLVEKIETFPQPISHIFFDFNNDYKLVKGCAKEDSQEKGSLILYLENNSKAKELYNFSDGIPIIGVWLAGDWSQLLRDEEKRKNMKAVS